MKGAVENRYLLSKGLECFKEKEVKSNPKKIYLIISNSEIFNGIVEDKFTPMIKESLQIYNAEISWSILLPYNQELINFEINNAVRKGAEVIIVTKGFGIDDSNMVSLAKQIS